MLSSYLETIGCMYLHKSWECSEQIKNEVSWEEDCPEKLEAMREKYEYRRSKNMREKDRRSEDTIKKYRRSDFMREKDRRSEDMREKDRRSEDMKEKDRRSEFMREKDR